MVKSSMVRRNALHKKGKIRSASPGMRHQKAARAPATKARKSHGSQKGTGKELKPNTNIYSEFEVKGILDSVAKNEIAVGYLKKNVSKRALDVLSLLTVPKTDEELAEGLDMKINAVRRILNLLQGNGVTNYYVSKNVNGWLSFAWYINVGKLRTFVDHIEEAENSVPIINAACNDYFVCNSCYEKTKLIFTFDAAFEEGFKCSACSTGLAMINKEEAMRLVENAVAAQKLESFKVAALGISPDKA